MSDKSDTLLAFLLGAVTGAVAALLLAPDKGSETRRKLREGVVGLVEKGGELVGEARHGLQEKKGEITDAAHHQVSAVKAAVSEAKDAYHREMQKG